MSDDGGNLSPITFTYEYAGNGWARATIASGATTYSMEPSYVLGDPLFGLVAAVDEVLTYGGKAGCTWFYEAAADRWTLQRMDNTLHIIIRRLSERFVRPDWPTDDRGEVCFSVMCDLWKFAAKVRLAASRLVPQGREGIRPLPGEHYHDPSMVQHTPEYRALRAFLENHKREQLQPPAKSKGR